MKVLLLNDYSTATGGAEIASLALRSELRARGHDARLFASSAQVGTLSRQADIECFGTTTRWRTLLQTANPTAYLRLRRVLAEFRPDVVHVNLHLTQLSPAIVPLLAGFPSLYHAHWYRAVCPTGTKLLPNDSVCRSSPG